MDSPTQHQNITTMNVKISNVMWFLYGFVTLRVMLILLIVLFVPSGDSSSIRERREALRTLTMPPSTVIR